MSSIVQRRHFARHEDREERCWLTLAPSLGDQPGLAGPLAAHDDDHAIVRLTWDRGLNLLYERGTRGPWQSGRVQRRQRLAEHLSRFPAIWKHPDEGRPVGRLRHAKSDWFVAERRRQLLRHRSELTVRRHGIEVGPDACHRGLFEWARTNCSTRDAAIARSTASVGKVVAGQSRITHPTPNVARELRYVSALSAGTSLVAHNIQVSTWPLSSAARSTIYPVTTAGGTASV
jgi:hypothetical protein